MKTRPVLTIATIQSALAAIISLVVAFGVTLTPEQTAAIIGVWAAIGPILFAMFAQSKVTPWPPPPDASASPDAATVIPPPN